MKIRIELDHAKSLAIHATARRPYPAIPKGCNTYKEFFLTSLGDYALIVNQCGFAPEAADNEEQVNGCLVIQCIDKAYHGKPSLAKEKLNNIFQTFVSSSFI